MKNIGFYIIFIILLVILAFLVNFVLESTVFETTDEELLKFYYFCDLENDDEIFPISILSCDNNNVKFYMINYSAQLPNPVYTKDKKLIEYCNNLSTSDFCKNLVCSKSPSRTFICN